MSDIFNVEYMTQEDKEFFYEMGININNYTNMEQREKDIVANKTFRKTLDENLQGIKELTPSRERSLAITKLQEAIMWLGMDLKRLNEPNPYPESKNPENTIVEPTADDLKL